MRGGDPAAEHRLLAEEVGLRLLLEGGLDHPRAPRSDRARVRERDLPGHPRRVLVHGDEARRPVARHVGRPHQVPRRLRRDHDHVEVGPRLDLAEVDVEPVGEGERGALAGVPGHALGVDLRLVLVRREHHHDVARRGGLRYRRDPRAPPRAPSPRSPTPNGARPPPRRRIREGCSRARGPASHSRRPRPCGSARPRCRRPFRNRCSSCPDLRWSGSSARSGGHASRGRDGSGRCPVGVRGRAERGGRAAPIRREGSGRRGRRPWRPNARLPECTSRRAHR